MTKKEYAVITLLSTAIMILLFLLSRRLVLRFDLTGRKVNTLSPVSRNLGGEIGEELRITYFLSGKLLSLDPAPSEIRDLLREYEAHSRGKIQVAVRDPGGSGDAERFGLLPQQLQNVEQDAASFAVVYSGIVIEYLNKFEVLPWVFSLDTLEYDITSRVRSLTGGKRRELGVIAPESQKSWNEYYGLLNQALVQSGFTVLPLRPGEDIPDTLPVLFVLGGVEELDESGLYRIDRYIQLGGRVLFAVESVEVDLYGSWEGRLKNDRGLLAMIASYGAEVGRSLALDRSCLPVPYQDPYTQRMRLVRYAPWIGVAENPDGETGRNGEAAQNGETGQNGGANRGGETNRGGHMLASGFGGLDFFWASPLTLNLPPSGTVAGQALFYTSPEAWLMTRDFTLQPEQYASFGAEEESTRGEKILAAALEGRFPRWFAGEKPAPAEGAGDPDRAEDPDRAGDTAIGEESGPELPGMPGEAKESRIIVVGDSDLGGALSAQYYQAMAPLGFSQSSGLNLGFLLQAADWLGNDDDIVGIRNRRSGSGRLDRIADEDRRLALMSFSRTLNVFIVPLGIVLFGAVRLIKRKYKKEQDHAL
ncbi:MAG: GldG family protein [Treponema sp.]|jgi:ABC-type uncharacterized transport system involved in gliding motility auxiliary subunit|nr:GldG family protein [Treponema sp.]